MKHFFTLLCFSFFSVLLPAQNVNPGLQINRANKWYFGQTSAGPTNDAPSLHFDSGLPVVVNIGPGTGFSTACDSMGQLQIYGGGFSLYNKSHTVVSNASGIIGDTVTTIQSSLAVPKPKDANLVYYFTVPLSLKYNLVDMSLDSGRGSVIKKNIQVYPYPPGTGAKIAAVHHCNGSDVWVVVHELNTDKFLAYLLSDTGLNLTPVVTPIGPMDNEQGFASQGGLMKFSSNGKKLAITTSGFAIPPYLFDFDNSTGIISNPIPLQKDTGEQGISFSPDNSLLYIATANGRLLQYNLNTPNIPASRKLISETPTLAFSTIQMGRDGKIYLGQAGSPAKHYLGVINNPNVLDTFCHFSSTGIYLNGSYGARGLMNTVESYFYTGSSAFPCYGDTIVSSATMYNNQFGVRAFPNPFDDYTLIEVNDDLLYGKKVEYYLYDALGKKCNASFSELGTANYPTRAMLRRGDLMPGLYFLVIKTKNQTLSLKLSIL